MAMGVDRRVAAGVAAAVAVVALVSVGPAASSSGSTPLSGAKSASGAKLVTFVRPTDDTLVQKGTGPIRVIVQLRAGARLTKVDVDGVDVTSRLRPGPGGDYGALLSFGAHLHYGYNDAFAKATGRDGRVATGHVRFIVAQRDDSLLRLTGFRTDTPTAPLQVGVRETTGTHVRATFTVADGARTRVYLNGLRVDGAFSQQGHEVLAQLGADDGLRFGSNLVQILVDKTHPYKRQSSYDIESRTVYIDRDAPIASAGADRTITQGDIAELNGRATKLPPGWTRRSFRWTILTAPKGSKAKLRDASGSQPTLAPNRPGRYEVRVSVRGTLTGPRPRPTSDLGAQDAAATGVSNDTATVTVLPDIPPAGLRLDTLSGNAYDDRQMLLDGKPVPGTSAPSTNVNYAVIDRRTLEVKTSGSVEGDVAGIQQLGTIIDGYTGSLDYLVVLNWYSFRYDIGAERNALDTVLQKIGSDKLTDEQRGAIEPYDSEGPSKHGSAVGVAGAPAGSAFVTFAHDYTDNGGGMSGYLRLNGVTGKYDFVFTDPVDFNTEPNQTKTDSSPAQLTFKVGGSSYTDPNPGGGVSGFHLLILDANTLQEQDQGVYTTNAADGAEQPTEVQRLVSRLSYFNLYYAGSLVMLQAFGAPHGNDGPWDEVAKDIERLGGTRQVFDALNAVDPRPLNGEDPHRKGPYALVGRVGETAPPAEQSYSLNGLPGQLTGVLMRAHDGGYEPMIAAPARSDGESPVNTELIDIANNVHHDFPAFKDTKGKPVAVAHAAAVQKFLGGRAVTGLCSAAALVCDIRTSYYKNYRANWSSTQDDLTNAKAKCAKPPPGSGFTASECEGIRVQLRDEVSMVAKVTQYFGPLGLQQPFGATGVSALANLTEISQEINDAVKPVPADNTTSNNLAMIGQILFPTPTTPYPGVFSSLSAAFSLAAYFTKENGSPNLIGPQVTTAASKLGVELADRYQQAGDHLDDLGRLIVSDYGKLTAVASKVDAQPGPGETDWRLGNVGQARDELVLAAKQTIYERLVPLAYPVMYDLGERISNARDWYCDGQAGDDKHLFAEQADGAQFVGRFPATGWSPLIAVAAAQATGDHYGARIPGVPASITDVLFKSPANGGLGLNKLEFYSPRNGFRWFPPEPSRASPEGQTLHQFPYPDANPYFDATDRLLCVEIPNPPDNSG